jgi:hypothetical protein
MFALQKHVYMCAVDVQHECIAAWQQHDRNLLDALIHSWCWAKWLRKWAHHVPQMCVIDVLHFSNIKVKHVYHMIDIGYLLCPHTSDSETNDGMWICICGFMALLYPFLMYIMNPYSYRCIRRDRTIWVARSIGHWVSKTLLPEQSWESASRRLSRNDLKCYEVSHPLKSGHTNNTCYDCASLEGPSWQRRLSPWGCCRMEIGETRETSKYMYLMVWMLTSMI